jgi:hypothetical protein
MKWRLETYRKLINGLFQLSTIIRNCSGISFVGENTSSPLARGSLLSKFVDILQHSGTTFRCQLTSRGGDGGAYSINDQMSWTRSCGKFFEFNVFTISVIVRMNRPASWAS